MKKHIKTAFIVTSILASSLVIAKDKSPAMQGNQDMMGSSAQMQKMMDQRAEMIKTSLKLDKKQEKAFSAYIERKKSMMEDMMGLKQASMKNTKGMQGGQMGDMQGKKSMQDHHGAKASQQGMMGNQQGMGGKMGLISVMSFIERMNFMQKHAKKMSATSKTGRKFYKMLSAEQKKKLDDMPKNMGGMNSGGMNMGGMNKNQMR